MRGSSEVATEGYIQGRLVSGVDACKRYEAGRKCWCGTVLSIYNRHDTCWAHTPVRYVTKAPRSTRRLSA